MPGWFIWSLEEDKVPMFDLFKSPQQTEQQGVHATGTFLPQCLGRSLDERASESHSVTEGDFPHFPACVSLCVHSDGTSNRLVMHAAHPFAREKLTHLDEQVASEEETFDSSTSRAHRLFRFVRAAQMW